MTNTQKFRLYKDEFINENPKYKGTNHYEKFLDIELKKAYDMIGADCWNKLASATHNGDEEALFESFKDAIDIGLYYHCIDKNDAGRDFQAKIYDLDILPILEEKEFDKDYKTILDLPLLARKEALNNLNDELYKTFEKLYGDTDDFIEGLRAEGTEFTSYPSLPFDFNEIELGPKLQKVVNECLANGVEFNETTKRVFDDIEINYQTLNQNNTKVRKQQ